VACSDVLVSSEINSNITYMCVNQPTCMDVYVIAAKQLEFRVKLSACISSAWKPGSFKGITGDAKCVTEILGEGDKIRKLGGKI